MTLSEKCALVGNKMNGPFQYYCAILKSNCTEWQLGQLQESARSIYKRIKSNSQQESLRVQHLMKH